MTPPPRVCSADIGPRPAPPTLTMAGVEVRLERRTARLDALVHALLDTGLNLGSARVLARLAKGPATIDELAAATRSQQGTVSRALARLVARGWVQRTPQPGDGTRGRTAAIHSLARPLGDIVLDLEAAALERHERELVTIRALLDAARDTSDTLAAQEVEA